MDKDRDGTITEDEIQHAVKTIGLKLNDTQMLELMNRMDLDGDGVLVRCMFDYPLISHAL